MSVGAASDRVAELLEQWLAGVELHTRYLSLDDAAYARVQDWPSHQRPTRWILDLARKRCTELRRQLDERSARGDESFADALELMAFLANLLGAEHLERFIPLPDTRNDRRPIAEPAPAAAPVPAAASAAAPVPAPVPVPAPAPAPRAAAKAKPAPEGRAKTRPVAAPRTGRPAPATQAPRKPAQAPAAGGPSGGVDARSATVIADAVRMLNWGRPWPELAGLIARLADRPSEAEIWEILRRHRAEISAQSSPPAD